MFILFFFIIIHTPSLKTVRYCFHVWVSILIHIIACCDVNRWSFHCFYKIVYIVFQYFDGILVIWGKQVILCHILHLIQIVISLCLFISHISHHKTGIPLCIEDDILILCNMIGILFFAQNDLILASYLRCQTVSHQTVDGFEGFICNGNCLIFNCDIFSLLFPLDLRSRNRSRDHISIVVMA